MKESCNNCKWLWDTLDINCVCLYDDLPLGEASRLNGDFLSVPANCENFDGTRCSSFDESIDIMNNALDRMEKRKNKILTD